MSGKVGFKSGVMFTFGAMLAVVMVAGAGIVAFTIYRIKSVQARGEVVSFISTATGNSISRDFEYFITDTESCKGKSLTLSMTATTFGESDADGVNVNFFVICGRQKSNILIYCPFSVFLLIDVKTDYAVQFTCNDGAIDRGNVATRIIKTSSQIP